MTGVKNALIKQYAYVFGLEDVVLHASDAALRTIARQVRWGVSKLGEWGDGWRDDLMRVQGKQRACR